MKIILITMFASCTSLYSYSQTQSLPSDSLKFSNTFSDNSPLYILNGKTLKQDSLKFILTENIESIEVLKGEKAEATYGARGKNGVVIITLKDPKKLRSFNKKP